VPSPVDLVDLPFLREALVELALLAVAGGVVGAWIVLRRLAFYSHAVGSATFPGLVTADATGISATLLAMAVALGYAGGVGVTRADGERSEATTALLLVAALALGVVLASDVFESGSSVDRLLFGTLLGLDRSDLLLSGAGALAALAATVACGRVWTAAGFDPEAAGALGVRARWADLGLLALVAFAAVAAIPAVGALLVGAVFILPAAAARLLARSVRGLLGWAVALALAEGVVGLYLAYWLDAPPGPPIAVLGASLYGALALAAALASRRPASPAVAPA
jgi:ABC-type Mn2+/Zn2+ transport system permease subunit